MKLPALLIVLFCIGTQALESSDLPAIPENGDLWVVLAAGSNGWFNYRHQADVCHAYQIVHAHGVPDDHIIVMMYDDIAFNTENPTPGKIINHPNGTDVYKGVPKDYTCNLVNPMVFLQVLQGEEVTQGGSGKVLKSGPNDHVFVYFSDHGAKGLVAFGEAILKATELNMAIKKMHEKKMFSKLVFYLEACESGSMFKGLLDPNMNVFATTASNSTTSSYACYYDDKRRTFLGDVYSIKWLEDSDKQNIEKETLEQQYTAVKKETNTSTVCQFGDMSINQLPVGQFQGLKPVLTVPQPPPHFPPSYYSCGRDAVPGPDVPLHILNKIIQSGEATQEEVQEARERLASLQKNRRFMESKMVDIVKIVTANTDNSFDSIYRDNVELTEYQCYYAAVDMFHEKCFNLGRNDYGLRQLNPLVNLCEKKVDADSITSAIQAVCDHPPMYGIY